MALSVGIVGLPNSGKSTLFNALLGRQMAEVGEYPFTTIKPHEGVVAVPDGKLGDLGNLGDLREAKIIPATVTFIDIAGLVKDAHKGEGLGNQFLAKIREVDAVCQVVRVFENSNVAHYYGSIDPGRDIEIVNLELELGEIKKPAIYVANVDEKQLTVNRKSLIVNSQKELGIEAIPICAKLEAELSEFSPEERWTYLKELGIEESGLDKLIKKAYALLGLITFYTIKGGKEVRAWSLIKGKTAPEAAEEVHTDMAKGFIKAEVIEADELIEIGSWKKAQEQGKIRIEGRDYQIKDGEVVEFKFNS